MPRSPERYREREEERQRGIPYWRRVPRWWVSALIAIGPLLRLLLGESAGWARALDVALFAACVVMVTVDVLRRGGPNSPRP